VKEFWKSVNICRSYGQYYSSLFFIDSRCILSVPDLPLIICVGLSLFRQNLFLHAFQKDSLSLEHKWSNKLSFNSPSSLSAHHRTTLMGCIFATKTCADNRKKKQNLSLCPHNMVNFSPLAAQIGWRVWGTTAKFNGFRLLASLLHRHRSTEVNQTSLNVWPSPGLVHYMHCGS